MIFMGLRPARTMRNPKQQPPYTRYAPRTPRKSYVKSKPHQRLNNFEMGVLKEDYNVKMLLVSKTPIQIRDNAIEAARMTITRHLEKNMSGKYKFWVKKYPHHVVRENKMLTGAGADRLSKGMRKSFGKPTHIAVRMGEGDVLFEIWTYEANSEIVKDAFRKARQKLSGEYQVKLETINN